MRTPEGTEPDAILRCRRLFDCRMNEGWNGEETVARLTLGEVVIVRSPVIDSGDVAISNGARMKGD